MNMRVPSAAALSLLGLALVFTAGACREDRGGFVPPPSGFDENPQVDAGECPFQCSLDGRSVVRSCSGEVVETCPVEQACGAARCQEPCAAAADDRSSNGCEFYFQQPVVSASVNVSDSCFATFVVNTSTQDAEVSLEYEGKPLDVSKAMFRTNPGDATLIPHAGPVAPGESIIVFVSDGDRSVPKATSGRDDSIGCPEGVVPAFVAGRSLLRTGLGTSFRLHSSKPVSLVAMYPFGGAESFIPTASLLLPVVTWGSQHVVVNPWQADLGQPTTQIVASEDGTEVTIRPLREIQNGAGVAGGAVNAPTTYRLGKGQHVQFVQHEELSGSIVTSNKPTTLFGGHSCANLPFGYCDVLWQQIPAFEQWGSEYAVVGYRPRVGDEGERMPYRIVAARDGTRLDYDPEIPIGAPTELSAGEVATFPAGVGDAFVVRTQDAEHPIYMAAYMTGTLGGYHGSKATLGFGDPEFVNVVPAGQYLNAYSFYADPTYSETSLVIVRAKSHGVFKDVWLECAGTLTEWKPIGARGDYEFTRVDLTRNRGPGQTFGDKTCTSGLQRTKSDGPFTATIWGWAYCASYAYPGGMAHRKLVTTPLDPLR